MSNTLVSDNNVGIIIDPAGSGTTNAVLDHVEMENNASDGLSVKYRLPDRQHHHQRQREREQRSDGIHACDRWNE